jgi:hypothetical protein
MAMMVLAIALLGVAQLQITAIQGNRFSYDMTLASALASDELERMVQVYHRDPVSVSCLPPETLVRSDLVFNRTCVLTGTEPGHRTAEVTVTWRNAQGLDRRVVARTLL